MANYAPIPAPSTGSKTSPWLYVIGGTALLLAGAVIHEFATGFGMFRGKAEQAKDIAGLGREAEFYLTDETDVEAANRVVNNYMMLRRINCIRTKCIKQDTLNILTMADAADGELDGTVSLSAVREFVQKDLERLAGEYKGQYPHVESIPGNMYIGNDNVKLKAKTAKK